MMRPPLPPPPPPPLPLVQEVEEEEKEDEDESGMIIRLLLARFTVEIKWLPTDRPTNQLMDRQSLL